MKVYDKKDLWIRHYCSTVILDLILALIVPLLQFHPYFNRTLNQNTPLFKIHPNSNFTLTLMWILFTFIFMHCIKIYYFITFQYKTFLKQIMFLNAISISHFCFQYPMMFLNDNVSNIHRSSTRGWNHVQWRHRSLYNESFVGTFLPYYTFCEKRVHLNVQKMT